MSRAMTFFKQATQLVPVITAMAGACVSAAGGYFAIRSELVDLRRTNEQTQAKLEEHTIGFDHDHWFTDDWIRHPMLRGAIERYIQGLQERENLQLHSCYAKREECESKWQRFFELNPALVRPGSH